MHAAAHRFTAILAGGQRVEAPLFEHVGDAGGGNGPDRRGAGEQRTRGCGRRLVVAQGGSHGGRKRGRLGRHRGHRRRGGLRQCPGGHRQRRQHAVLLDSPDALGVLADLRQRAIRPGADPHVALTTGLAGPHGEIDDHAPYGPRLDPHPAGEAAGVEQAAADVGFGETFQFEIGQHGGGDSCRFARRSPRITAALLICDTGGECRQARGGAERPIAVGSPRHSVVSFAT